MTRWEYMTFRVEAKGIMSKTVDADVIRSRFNKLGIEGWELVAVPTDSTNGWTEGCIFILKRPIAPD